MSKTIVDSLSLVVPVLNEQEIIEETIGVYNSNLKNVAKIYEIIVVDDGSNDSTPEILKSLRNKNKVIKIITHEKNMGVGKALFDGFKAARYEWVMHNSADQPFDINNLKKIANLFQNSDVIVAVREDRSANTLFRKLTSLTSLMTVKIFFGTDIRDFHFIQIYKTSILKNIKIGSKDTFMPAELLITLHKKGYIISQFPARFQKRTTGYSKYDNPVRYFIYLKELLKFWWKINSKNHAN